MTANILNEFSRTRRSTMINRGTTHLLEGEFVVLIERSFLAIVEARERPKRRVQCTRKLGSLEEENISKW